MNEQRPKPSAAVSLAKQAYYGFDLGEELPRATHALCAYARDVWRERSRDSWGSEDHEPRLVCFEVDNRMVRNLRRVACIDAVLERLEDVATGFAEVSNRPIARRRLESAADAICTLDGQGAFEANSNLGRIQ